MADTIHYELSRNQRRILDLIRHQGPISRAELAVETGLTAGAVTRHIKELLQLSLVMEGARRSGMRGQPALPISIRPDAAHSIGVSFSLHEIEAVALDFCGNEITRVSEEFDCRTAEGLAFQCAALVTRLEKASRLGSGRILGVGVALPGSFISDNMPVTMNAIDVLSLFSDIDPDVFGMAFQCETWVEKSSSTAALAEYYDRTEARPRDLILVNIGYDFSAGYIVGGHLFRGRHSNAGDIGRFCPQGTSCPSMLDLVNDLNRAGRSVQTRKELRERIAASDPVVGTWVSRTGEQISHAISMLDSALAPEEIVLGGMLPEGLLAELLLEVRKRSYMFNQPMVSLRASRFGSCASAVGAAYLPIHQTCSP